MKAQFGLPHVLSALFDVCLFLFFSLCLKGNILCLVVFVFQWVVGFKEQVLVCVCGLPVTVNVEASVLLNEHCTVREWKPVFFGIRCGELVCVC